jgi:hypothetical protein
MKTLSNVNIKTDAIVKGCSKGIPQMPLDKPNPSAKQVQPESTTN